MPTTLQLFAAVVRGDDPATIVPDTPKQALELFEFGLLRHDLPLCVRFLPIAGPINKKPWDTYVGAALARNDLPFFEFLLQHIEEFPKTDNMYNLQNERRLIPLLLLNVEKLGAAEPGFAAAVERLRRFQIVDTVSAEPLVRTSIEEAIRDDDVFRIETDRRQVTLEHLDFAILYHADYAITVNATPQESQTLYHAKIAVIPTILQCLQRNGVSFPSILQSIFPTDNLELFYNTICDVYMIRFFKLPFVIYSLFFL